MGAARTPLIIPAEILAREFDGKLLLSCLAAERGFKVILGCKATINRKINLFPRSIYVAKGLTPRSLRLFRLLDKMGHRIVSSCEEGLVYYSDEVYRRRNVSPPVMQKASALLAWGPNHARVWRESEGYHGAPIYQTGSPRVDLMRPELRPFFDRERRQLLDRFGPFILINSNFATVNSFFPHLSKLPPPSDSEGKAPRIRRGVVYDPELAAYRNSVFQAFLDLVPALAAAFPDHAVIVRPHPSENHEAWKKAGVGFPNVRVVYEGSVIPWLLASTAMIHHSCTTGLEAYVLDRSVIAYCPVPSERYRDSLSNSLSHQVFDVDSVIAGVRAAIDGSFGGDRPAELARRQLLERYLVGHEGPLACDRILDVLEQIDRAGALPARSMRLRIDGHLGAARRAARKWVKLRIPGDRNHADIIQHAFPDLSLSEVRSRVSRFQELLGRFPSVQVRERSRNVFEISPGR